MDDVSQSPNAWEHQDVEAMTYFDLQVRYDLTDNMDVYFGIDNLTNKQPPYCPTCNNEPVPGAHYTAESYARVWDSKFHYIGLRWQL